MGSKLWSRSGSRLGVKVRGQGMGRGQGLGVKVWGSRSGSKLWSRSGSRLGGHGRGHDRGGQCQGVKVSGRGQGLGGVGVRWSVGFSGRRLEINREWFFQETHEKRVLEKISQTGDPFHY